MARRWLAGCCVRMLVVQLVVMALYQRGLFRRALREWMYSRKTFARPALAKSLCGKDRYSLCGSLCAGGLRPAHRPTM